MTALLIITGWLLCGVIALLIYAWNECVLLAVDVGMVFFSAVALIVCLIIYYAPDANTVIWRRKP